MSACCLFSGVFECDIFIMDKEMRKTKNTSLPSPFLFLQVFLIIQVPFLKILIQNFIALLRIKITL